ncbi:signal recognition particle subunit [Hypoxylon texense]
MTEDNNDHPSPSTTSPSDRSPLPTTSSAASKTASPLSRNRPQQAMAPNPHHDREVAGTKPEPMPIRARHPLDDHPALTTPGRAARKRIQSIDVEEANHPRIEDLRLYTPSTAKSNISEGPRELICLCTKAPKVPRPRNAFILYRQHYQGQVAARHPGLANPEISKLIGEQWREQPDDVKESWKRLAEEEKIRHQRQYPDYRYQPRRGGKTANTRPLSASGEDPGHCPKCGGRYIATPRTPSTPYSAATPEFAKPTSNMPPYQTPNSRVIENDHLRRGSISSTMSSDGLDRRYLKHPTDEYAMLSPDAKRRRTDVSGLYHPNSPSSMAYVLGEPHYQHPSVSGHQSNPTGGFGPGSLPRPGIHYHQPQPGYVAAPQHHIQARPRASTSYQPPTRPSTGFDESLRLPPLQTQVPNSPAKSSEAELARAPPASTSASSHGTGLGIMNGNIGHARQAQPTQHMPPKYPFLFKLDILQQVTQPLPFQPFKTRGPFIAIETHDSELSRQVARVVRNALAEPDSGKYAVKIWEDETAQSVEAQMSMPEEWKGLDDHQLDLDERQLMVYKARMLKWDIESIMIERYITGQSQPSSKTSGEGGESTKSESRLPVAIVADGWSLTISERYADLLRVRDAYSARDHWQWLATLWRGNIGADLTIYVSRVPEAEISSYIKLISPSVMMLYVPSKSADELTQQQDVKGGGYQKDAGAGAAHPDQINQPKLDETLRGPMERRLAFEVEEWVRRGHFKVDGQVENT